MHYVKGLDLSFAQPPLDWWQARKAEGFEVAVQCLWTGTRTPASAISNIINSKQVGMLTGGYATLSGAYGKYHIEQARRGIESALDPWGKLGFVAVGVELSLTKAEAQIAEAIQAIEDYGKVPAIYTSYSKWREITGNSTKFSHVRLWNALWDLTGDTPDFPRLPYGGWKMPIFGEQYRGDYRLDGYNVDLNVFAHDLLPSPAKPVQPPPAPPHPANKITIYQARPTEALKLGWPMRLIPGMTVHFDGPARFSVSGHLDIATTRRVRVVGCAVDVLLDGRRIDVTGENIDNARHYYSAQLHGVGTVGVGIHVIKVRARAYSDLALRADDLARVKAPQYSLLLVRVEPL